MDPVDENIVSFEVRSGDGPGVIGSAGSRDYTCVVMPVKLRKD